ncbi:MAG: YlbF family regulator, partial [Oscillospiraceae bacterium]
MEIIELTRELGRTIQEDPRYKTLRETSAACDKDEELQKMIGDFNLTRMNLSNMMNDPDQDQKKMQELNEQLTSVYEKVMQNEHMTA